MPDFKRINIQNFNEKKNNINTRLPENNITGYSNPFSGRILSLQRSIGNQAVQSLIKSGILQTKLKIGSPGDIYEKEADRIADEVMCMQLPNVQRAPVLPLKRGSSCDSQDNFNQIQTKPDINRQPLEEEKGEEMIKTKASSDKTSEDIINLEFKINALKGRGQPLPEFSRAFFEPRFNADFSGVKVHNDSSAAQMNRRLNAKAFTNGKDIYFNQGAYNPDSDAGKQLLAHELTHVIQQNNYSPKRTQFIINRQVEGTQDEESDNQDEGLNNARSIGATTPDGVDLGPTSPTDTFCKRGTFLGAYTVSQNTGTDAKGNAVITFRGTSSGRVNNRACSCNCGVYRQFIKHYWRLGSSTAAKRHDFSSCGHNLTASETNWTEEYTSCIGDNDPDACRFSYSDFPGLSGLTNGTYAEAWWRFKFQIWDRCRNVPVSTAFKTLTIRGTTAPRTIRWT